MFNFEEYAGKESLDHKRGPGYERILDCPLCGKSYHLYFNINKNLWNCKKCGESGNYIRFVMAHKNLPYKRVLEFLDNGINGTLNVDGMRKKLQSSVAKMNISYINNDRKLVIFPPKNARQISPKRYPKFFNLRGYDPEIIFAISPLVCETYPYANRIIFPFGCDGHSSFVAYAGNKYMQPKTLNPKYCNNAELLYGYNFFSNEDILFLVEGITDVIRLVHYGYASCALLGKNISYEQVYLLHKHKCKEIVICYDGDVPIKQIIDKNTKTKVRGIIDYTSLLVENLHKKLSFMIIRDSSKDPDTLTKTEFDSLFEGRVGFKELARVKKRL